MFPSSRRSVLRSVGILGSAGLIGVTSARSESHVITECTVIDEPGDYVLESDLVDEEFFEGVCIEITADNVTLDGRGHEIRGGDGVLVTGANVTVENLTLRGFEGIRYHQTSGGTIQNNTTSAEEGIILESTTQTVIEGNECSDDLGTIELNNADGNVVQNNEISGEYGPLLSDSSRNRIEDNYIRQAEVGITVGGTRNAIKRNTVTSTLTGGIIVLGDRNRLHQNTVTETQYTGITLTDASRNRLHRNEVTDGEDVGVSLEDADDNWLVQNTVCDNEGEQIVIDEDSTGNRLVRNDTEC